MIIIQASNIHQGGGAVLLNEILNFLRINKNNCKYKLFIDSRFKNNELDINEITLVKASVLSRFKIELVLANLANQFPKEPFLFFGNLPPLFKSNENAYLFFQNQILLDTESNFSFGLKTKFKHFIERQWLKYGINYIKTVYVQSESVKRSFLRQFPSAQVKVLAFSNLSSSFTCQHKTHEFIYVASSDPHKNHINLFKAWIYLFENGVKPKLTITAATFSEEANLILNSALAKGVNIEILPNLSHEEALKLYSASKALVYPSFTESFGLPLLEAKQVDLPIIASELDYVRDLVDPMQTFDPHSEISIARAIERFLNQPESGKTEVKTAADFINNLLS